MSQSKSNPQITSYALPGLNCGGCGYRTCDDFARHLAEHPEDLKRCIHISATENTKKIATPVRPDKPACGGHCATCFDPKTTCDDSTEHVTWKDSLDREFDFILDTFPNEPGPRETIRLHNPALTREMAITKGDILIGRPLGMSCGCPITHCGVVMHTDTRTGVVVWCITGPLGPRTGQHKDIGYYSAEAYEGLIHDTRLEIRVGMRCWFIPRRCMLQWRHSGLVNFISRTSSGIQVRVEGLLIG